jgi:hypothetical protein
LPIWLLVAALMIVASATGKHEKWRMSGRGRWPGGEGEADSRGRGDGGGWEGDGRGHCWRNTYGVPA